MECQLVQIQCLALREELLDAACPSWLTTAGLEAFHSLKRTATLAETLGTIPEGNSYLIYGYSWLVSKIGMCLAMFRHTEI